MTSVANSANPFFESWTTPNGAPPFDRIVTAHFEPAFERGLQEQVAEIAAIKSQVAPPTFENTILAMERAAETLIWSIEHLPPTQFVAVSQDGLRTNGEAITRRVLERLCLTPIADSSALRNAVERLSKGRVETYTATIPSVQAAARARLDEAQDRALRHAGIEECS